MQGEYTKPVHVKSPIETDQYIFLTLKNAENFTSH